MTALPRYIVTADGEPVLETDSIRIARAQAAILARTAITRVYERTPRGQRIEVDFRDMERRADDEVRESFRGRDL